MESVLFPFDFFDFPEVSHLPPEHKLVLAFGTVHPQLTPAATLRLSPYVLAGLPLPADVVTGICSDLARRGIAAFDEVTGELFILASWTWHRIPGPDDENPWARQVRAAVKRIRSANVRKAVEGALAAPPEARIPSVKIPANLLTALPSRGKGQAWSATETLVAFVVAANPAQTPAGVFQPNLAALAALSSVPLPTFLEALDSLQAAGTVRYDEETSELFSDSRLRAAALRDVRQIEEIAAAIRSHLIFRCFSSCAKRRFPKINLKTGGYAPGEERGGKFKGGEGGGAFRNDGAAERFGLRHGPWAKDAA